MISNPTAIFQTGDKKYMIFYPNLMKIKFSEI